MTSRLRLSAVLLALLLAACGGSDPDPVACADLPARVTPSNATIVSATAVPAGDFTAPAQGCPARHHPCRHAGRSAGS